MKELLCKTCFQHRPAEGCIIRADAQGRLKARCKACVERVKEAAKSNG